MELSEVQREILQDVYNHFKFKNEWPCNRNLELKFHEHGDWQELIKGIGDDLIYTGIPYKLDGEVKLTIEGISHCRGKTKDLDNFISAIGIFYDRYINKSRDAVVSKEELINELKIIEAEAIRLCILISEAQSGLHSGGVGITLEKYILNFRVSNGILKFKNVNDINGYLDLVKHERFKIGRKHLSTRSPQKPVNKLSFDSFNVSAKGYEIHSDMQEVSSKLFEDGHYAQAVVEALKKVISKVKEMMQQKGQRTYDGGDSLMNHAFSGDNPIIKINANSTREEKDEQKGTMFLFKGIVAIRNRKAHENIVLDDPNQAYEYLCLASLLMRLLESSKEFDS